MADEAPLFDLHQRKKRKKEPVDPVVNAALQPLMFKIYGSLFRKRFGVLPVTTGRDWVTLKRLVTQYGAEMVERYLTLFLAWDGANDKWVQEEGWTLGVFYSRWNKLTQMQQPKGPKPVCDHKPPCPNLVEHSRRSLEEMRAF